MVTKKDFNLIADTLARHFPEARDTGGISVMYGYCQAIEVLANALQQTNPRFDRERFIIASKTRPVKENG